MLGARCGVPEAIMGASLGFRFRDSELTLGSKFRDLKTSAQASRCGAFRRGQ